MDKNRVDTSPCDTKNLTSMSTLEKNISCNTITYIIDVTDGISIVLMEIVWWISQCTTLRIVIKKYSCQYRVKMNTLNSWNLIEFKMNS